MLVGITRVRNESLIMADTLRHVLALVDHVIVYDDCSTDNTPEICKSFDRVTVIHGDQWKANRPAEETRHRALLLDAARNIGAEWVYCFDADERITGAFPDLSVADGFRVRLFDGYITPETSRPYTSGELMRLPRKWGPEYRDILMIFRVNASKFVGMDKREPDINGVVLLADCIVYHYGKCLSVTHWDETCRYYANHWPEPYKTKWKNRIGKAVHTLSDFGRPLYGAGEVITRGVKL